MISPTPSSSEVAERKQLELLSLTQPKVQSWIDLIELEQEAYVESAFIERAKILKQLALLFSSLSYGAYRLLVGTVNQLRQFKDITWRDLLSTLKNFKTELPSGSQLHEMINLLSTLISTEQKLGVQEDSPEATPGLIRQNPEAFVDDILWCSRALFPLGINILDPAWGGAREETVTASDHLTLEDRLIFECSRSRIKVLIKRSLERLDHFQITLRDPKSSPTIVEIGPQNTLIIGRDALVTHSLLGLPISLKQPVSLCVPSSIWSRAAIQLVCDASSHLYIFDRASRNPLVFKTFRGEVEPPVIPMLQYSPFSILPNPELDDAHRVSRVMGHTDSILLKDIKPN